MERCSLRRFWAAGVIVLVAVVVMLRAAWPVPRKVPPQPAPQAQQQTSIQTPTPPQAPPQLPRTEKKARDYFPLTKGSTWEYQGAGNEYASFRREVLFSKDDLAQILEDNGGTVIAAIFKSTNTAVTRVFSRPETYDRTSLLDQPPSENTVILSTPLAVGTKWNSGGVEREIVAVDATVDSPAGKFVNCIKVRIPGNDSTVFEYFAEGVGMVKREFISGEARVISTLKRFTIRK